MKSILSMSMFAVCIGSSAFAATPLRGQACTERAQESLADHLGNTPKALSYFNGALVGDGADAVEIDVFTAQASPGLYKVELDAEDCSVRNIEHLNN